MIRVNNDGKIEFDNKQDVIDYVLSDHCDFNAIEQSPSPFYVVAEPDESVRKMYITVYDGNNDPVIEWCCEDQDYVIFSHSDKQLEFDSNFLEEAVNG